MVSALFGTGITALKKASVAAEENVEKREYVLDMNGASTETLRFAEAIGDNMLYQQGKPVVVWGFAPAGDEISVTLSQQFGGGDCERIEVVADANGYFEGHFEPRQASYTEYKMEASDGVTTVTAEDILFGELFLSCGQSNMALNVQYCSNAGEIMETAHNPYIRVFMSPEIARDAELPYRPAAYYPGGVWARGDSYIGIAGASAVSYNFALSLFEKLNVQGDEVPVGFLNAAKGATSIEAWLSRPSVDSDENVRAYLASRNRLLGEEEYNKAGANNYNQVSGLFNSKIAPLSNFYIRGILWYQGENNVGNEIAGQYYKNALSLLMRDWSLWFNGGEEEIPLIFAQITPHNYGYEPTALAYMWEGMSEAYRNNSDRCAMVTTYDIPLDWYNDAFSSRSPIHPIIKKPVGERMSEFAFNMLYGGNGAKSSPVFSSVWFQKDKAVVSFENADGLKTTDGLDVVGFALCGENRIFYPADATINADGTITLSSIWVNSPVAVTYAFSTMISSANLCSEEGYPVAPFRSDKSESTYYHPKDWQTCDSLQYFVSSGSGKDETLAMMRDAYTSSSSAVLSVSENGERGNSIRIEYTLRGRETFWFAPVLNYDGVYEQFSVYDTLSFKVKNLQSRQVGIESIKVTLFDGRTGDLLLADGTGISAVVEKREEFQTFYFSLNTLVIDGENLNISNIRSSISEIKICFKDYAAGAIEIDDFQLGNLADLTVDLTSGEEAPSESDTPVGNPGDGSSDSSYSGNSESVNSGSSAVSESGCKSLTLSLFSLNVVLCSSIVFAFKRRNKN